MYSSQGMWKTEKENPNSLSKESTAKEVVQKWEKNQETLYLKVPAKLHNPDTLNKLRGILRNNVGKTAVVLHYESSKQTMQLANKDWVDSSASCLKELKLLLGEESVILK